MAEAVLTPRYKDLETGIWTRAAPLTEARYCEFGRGAKQKCSEISVSGFAYRPIVKTPNDLKSQRGRGCRGFTGAPEANGSQRDFLPRKPRSHS